MTSLDGDYLWDKTVPHDPEVERLEALLGTFRFQEKATPWKEQVQPIQSTASRQNRLHRLFMLAVPSALACLVAFALLIQARFEWRTGKPWRVSAESGSPLLAGKAMVESSAIAVGQTIETDATSRARVHVAHLGIVDIAPNSRLRLMATHEKRHRLQLEYGTISAHMWAPPFSLAVETPSAVLFDLGCAFTLHVEKGGLGTVQVTSGWVEFETPSRNIIIPSGAEAVTLPGTGPGTPYYSDATTSFKLAVADFDSHPGDEAVRANALQSITGGARPRDALTLLSMLDQLSPPQRKIVVDRLVRLVPPPVGYTTDEIVALETDAIDGYWRALHLGSPKSWVTKWKDALAF